MLINYQGIRLDRDGLNKSFNKVKNSINRVLLVSIIILYSVSAGATVYYVSNNGNDSNSGTSTSKSWKTLAKVNSFSFKPGDQVLFKKGDEWVGTLEVNSSGASGSPIVYSAYGTGAKPKIYGSEIITGWTRHSGNIYKATCNSDVEQLFVNNKRSKLARQPNSGYFKTTRVSGSNRFSSDDLKGGINYTGATWVGRTSAFTLYSKKVVSANSQFLQLESTPTYGVGKEKGFFLCNKLEFLDKAGEWYYDRQKRTLYLWAPNGGSPSNYVIRASTSKFGITVVNQNYVFVKDLDIFHSSVDGIYMENSDFVNIENNTIDNPDLIGIHLQGGKSNNVVLKNNSINNANGGGIRCEGHNIIITENEINHTGQLDNINKSTFKKDDNFGTGIYARGNSPVITYNRILNSGYCGINWKGVNGDISYNFIDGACQVLDDGGAIYSYNGYNYADPGSAGSVVDHNIILNCYGNPEGYTNGFYAGFGIYLDNAVHDVVLKNNLISGATGGITIGMNGYITIDGNTIMDATILLLINGQKAPSTVTNNIFYTLNRGGHFKWWGKNASQRIVYQPRASTKFDHNRYEIHHGTDDVFVNQSDFAAWQRATRQDSHSTFDGAKLADDETSVLFYNDTKQTKTINLGNANFKDINGNKVSGALKLEPFKSVILIKKGGSANVSVNHSPEVQDQTFNIEGELVAGSLVGQITASDPDAGQTLTYSIIQGNEENLFSINSSTGEISANANISKEKTIEVVIKVTDSNSSPSTANAMLTITVSPATTEPNESGNTDQNSGDNGQDSGNGDQNSDENSDTPNQPQPTSGFSEYLFEESGRIVNDSKGVNDGTIKGEFSRVDANNGNGVKLTGKGYIDVGRCFDENVTDQLTISAWLRPADSNGSYQGVVAHGTYAIYIHPYYKKIAFKTVGTSNEWFSVGNIDELWDGDWHHLTVTYNGNEKVIYLDGEPLGRVNANGRIRTGMDFNLLIGAGRDQGPSFLLYEGEIDEVRIQNYALSESEVEMLIISGTAISTKSASIEGTTQPDLPAAKTTTGNFSESELLLQNGVMNFNFYPNPASSYINIEFARQPEKTQIEIINSNGLTVYHREINTTVNKINISSLPSGMYFIKLQNINGTKVEKLMIN